MKYILKGLPVGPIAANCYIFGCANTKEAVIIDPGAEDGKIKALVAELGLSPKCVINTHCHADHIGANAKMGLPIFIHASDALCLTDPVHNLSGMVGMTVDSPQASRLLDDGDTIQM
ncbi:MAG: MBL fold metallo-hydrolase, partial [Candidatus Omnitrophica bacterium]|nr:MBL fold metallo-hydrolase [Candidatus Omnitrophota bacterium]